MARAVSREYHEGPEAAERFEHALRTILKVPKEELLRREAAAKKARQAERSRRRAR